MGTARDEQKGDHAALFEEAGAPVASAGISVAEAIACGGRAACVMVEPIACSYRLK
jgi:hypothetical protein